MTPLSALLEAEKALGIETESDARLNLMGALCDIKRKGLDDVCEQTINRVISQLAAAETALRAHDAPPRKNLEVGGERFVLERDPSCSEPAWESFKKFHDLIKHGAKIIDIFVRKDAREYTFQADILKYGYFTPSGKDAGEMDWKSPEDLPPLDERPARLCIIVGGFKQHSGSLWRRTYEDVVYIRKDEPLEIRREDYSRILKDGDMDAIEKIVAWKPFRFPTPDASPLSHKEPGA